MGSTNKSEKSTLLKNGRSRKNDFKTSKSKQNILGNILQESVTLFTTKDQVLSNNITTVAPEISSANSFFGAVPENVPVIVGAVIGISCILALFAAVATFWKCCSRVTILGKKKEYWLQPIHNPNKGRPKVPVVRSNAVVFLGLKPIQYSKGKSIVDTSFKSTPKIENSNNRAYRNHLHYTMSSEFPEVCEIPNSNESKNQTLSSNDNISVAQTCSIISMPQCLDIQTADFEIHVGNFPPTECRNQKVLIHRDCASMLNQSFHSETLDHQSLYSFNSRIGSEIDMNRCSFTWSSYSLRRPSTTDGYYDLCQKASFCKKRKNRMRSDIAAAIALNKSQCSQLNKDTELLVEREVEVISDERTTL